MPRQSTLNQQIPINGKIGFGLMGFTWRSQPKTQEEFNETLKYILDHHYVDYINSGEFYGNPPDSELNLKYLQAFFKKYPEYRSKVTISVKGGIDFKTLAPVPDVAGLRHSIDNILSFMPDGYLELFESARVNPSIPMETFVEVVREYIAAGKIGGLSLSEVSANTIRKVHALYPVSCVEVEFSLWSREILTNGVVETCGELGIPIVCYSPLGRGFLTGTIKKVEDIPENDMRRLFDRFSGDAFTKNLKLVNDLQELLKKWGDKNITMPKLALAWIAQHSELKNSPKFLAIPGGTTIDRVEENLSSQKIKLTEEQFAEVNKLVGEATVVGGRYNKHVEASLSV
ncbi:hypothetical protein BABINDRAFT_167671 [Babjeviella inositovora NRRL Y-12698]|uniref:NADP-dependent oxidoreductase domain-containing protein n=1 Tax=Babjeviella inositovora NRRL Y-12698 TaxID=984486 RepID=A0A1E3QN69_9ASCO|nr:uncharacterized protein BABINDRAFT_167671 [Babjeviella inositovora NRRL Y-12698]ODQ79135.1 hypothetical protein BABINDRAFT_167671 [Babjeviella inositovora NRRL Y-12698]